MSRLLSLIMLAILMFPLAAVLYLFSFFLAVETIFTSFGHRESLSLLFAGAVTSASIALYWTRLWSGWVRWTGPRIALTLAAGGLALGAGAVTALALGQASSTEFGAFLGSSAAPLAWLLLTIFIWRESPAERAERLRNAGTSALTCPTCGYNLTGLKSTRCPECGSEFTLDQLLAAQPHRATRELEQT